MTIRLEIADRVARVTIDRPEVLNALDAEAEERSKPSGNGSKPTATSVWWC